ncbi:aldo/keto reductase [Microbacterium aoyamense]|uniref:Aldo/keto reductase n=1 Tax=Microbacterium aoyamense TaxID=344166 RepID=A0ABN2PT56_9MICO|nr:aldo/keto reductase [Microbacterium aoyamense]
MPALSTRTLGRTGLSVSELGFGAMELRNTPHRHPRPVPNSVAADVLNTALDLGITFIDTSIDYGDSEERIGRFIGHRRDEFVLATKAGCPVEHQPHATTARLVHDYSPANLREGVEQSLYRLRTDHIDLLQVHLAPAVEELLRDDVAATLESFRHEGKVRFLGVSSERPELEGHLRLPWIDAVQLPYSALEPELELDIAALAGDDRGVIVRGGSAQGGALRARGSAQVGLAARDLDLGDLLDGESVAGLLLRFTLSTPGVSTVISGTADPGHLRANARAAQRGPLAVDVRNEIRRRYVIAAAKATTEAKACRDMTAGWRSSRAPGPGSGSG